MVTSEQIAEPKLTTMDEETDTSQNVPLGTIDLGSFEVLSDHRNDATTAT